VEVPDPDWLPDPEPEPEPEGEPTPEPDTEPEPEPDSSDETPPLPLSEDDGDVTEPREPLEAVTGLSDALDATGVDEATPDEAAALAAPLVEATEPTTGVDEPIDGWETEPTTPEPEIWADATTAEPPVAAEPDEDLDRLQ